MTRKELAAKLYDLIEMTEGKPERSGGQGAFIDFCIKDSKMSLRVLEGLVQSYEKKLEQLTTIQTIA